MIICFLLIAFLQETSALGSDRECGLPKNLNELPDFAREEIREIWKNYIPGSICTKELEIESDIIDVINTFDTEQNNSDGRKGTASPAPVDHDYDHIATNNGKPIPLSSSYPPPSSKLRNSNNDDDSDYLAQTTFDDVAMMQFDNTNAPFLRTVSSNVKKEFENVWEDPDIPSESLRSLKIQTLAVSLLSSQQLTEYNRWATKRRRVLKAREQEMRHLSSDAKQALRWLSVQKDEPSKIIIPKEVKNELTTFVQRLNRRRSLKFVH